MEMTDEGDWGRSEMSGKLEVHSTTTVSTGS